MAEEGINRTYLLGKDTKIVATSDDLIELDFENGDLKEADYLSNFVQALKRRLMSKANILLLHSSYGGALGSAVSEVMTPGFISILNIQLKRELLKDPRVESVEQLITFVSKDRRRLEVSFSVQAINQQVVNNITFSVPIVS